jgi:hypothetical protein
MSVGADPLDVLAGLALMKSSVNADLLEQLREH